MSISAKVIDYFKSARQELKKVIWPNSKETTRYSLLVIGVSLAVAAFFGILDFVFNLGLTKLISRF